MNPTLEFDELIAHHRRAWKVKRVAWFVMGLVIIAALAGAFGDGPASRCAVRKDGLELQYAGVARCNAPTRWQISLSGETNEVRISVNEEFVGRIGIERIDPEPVETLLDGPNQTFVFKGTSLNTVGPIRFLFRPNKIGRAHARIEVQGAGVFEIHPFYLP